MMLDDGYCYARNGDPITFEQWAQLHGDFNYLKVKDSVVGPYHVSTVWLGLNHQYGDGPPIIFETMVFSEDEWNDSEHHGLSDIDSRRYSTEEEAIKGHDEMCVLIEATLIEEIPNDGGT